MKFRNGVTNIGVACGFASLDEQGRLLVHQTSCREMALAFELSPGVRGPNMEYEPVTVLYQITPTEDPSEVVLTAVHVCRMARSMQPKSFRWNTRAWPINMAFYPFRPEKAGQLTDTVLDALVDEHDYPQWVVDAAAADDAFARLVNGTVSRMHLQNRLLLTGYLTAGSMVKTSRLEEAHDYLRGYVTQPDDQHRIGVRITPGTPGYNFMANSLPKSGSPTTILAKPIPSVTTTEDGETVKTRAFDLLLLEANSVVSADLEVNQAGDGAP